MAIFMAAPLAAGSITYVETGQVSGTLAGVALTNVPFTFTFLGDTTNITASGSILLNPAISNTITIGSSNGTFTIPVETGVVSGSNIIGFSDLARTDGITFVSAGVAGYNLATAISVSAVAPVVASGGSLGTSLGTLVITGSQDLTFTATTGVPEPGTFEFSLIALAGVTLIGLRRRKVG
jgi:hypothetical protein